MILSVDLARWALRPVLAYRTDQPFPYLCGQMEPAPSPTNEMGSVTEPLPISLRSHGRTTLYLLNLFVIRSLLGIYNPHHIAHPPIPSSASVNGVGSGT